MSIRTKSLCFIAIAAAIAASIVVGPALQRDTALILAIAAAVLLCAMLCLLDDLHRGQIELRRSERDFREMADASPVMVWVTDHEASITYANPPMRELIGPPRPSGATDHWIDLLHPDDADTARAIVQLAAIERRPFTIECRIVPSASAPRWVRISGRPRIDAHSNVRGFIGILDDIHEARLAEQILRESEEKFRSMFESAPVAIALCDVAGNILQANPRFSQLVGRQADDLAATPLAQLVADAAARVFVELARDSLLTRRLEPRESRILAPDGTSRPVLISGATVRTAEGHTRLWVFAEDISARLEIETRLRQTASDLASAKTWLEAQAAELHHQTEQLDAARRSAEAASQAKGQFLANMSHEIRTPMTAILGYADLLDDPELTDELRHAHIQTIKASGAHLLSILNDILDLSKIEAGRMTVERIAASPLQIARDVATLLAPRAAGRGITLDLHTSRTLPDAIPTDPIRLRQILINLVGNAIKFTEQGTVALHLNADRDARTLRIDVADTGIGMTPQQLDAVFSPFTQADPTMARRFGGTGLGLTICARLAEILGYRFTAVSQPGKGSTFSLHVALEHNPIWIDTTALPPARFSPPAAEHPKRQTQLKGRVLFAEDGPDNQRLIAHHLRKLGLSVTIVDNGRAVIDAVHHADRTGEPFELILLDMQMPVLDGYAAARELRALGVRTPIIALTAHAMAGDRVRCLQAGCDDYATKPIDRDRLVEVCSAWLNRAPAPTHLE